ncbi:MAG: hypothetical protein QXX95_00135 [Nitrososphaerales archaeon]
MSEEELEVRAKVKRLSQLLLLPRAKSYGVREWELRRSLGKNYLKYLDLLNNELDNYGLAVKVYGEGEDRRFFLVLKDPPHREDLQLSGYRIDELAILASSIAYLTSKKGKATKKEVLELLSDKIPKWKLELALRKFVRRGYLEEKQGILSLGWRSEVEFDRAQLVKLILRGLSQTS